MKKPGLMLTLLSSALVVSAAYYEGPTPPSDRYGQTQAYFEGKVTNDAELREDARKEWEHLKNVKFDSAKFDRHGGTLAAGQFKATGFFRLEKVNGKWWFVTPEGHLFFLIGCDSIHWDEGGYSTPLFDKGRPRPELTELPDPKTLPAAYTRKGRVNFLGANLQRKYGRDFEAKNDDVIRRRLIDWGFNSSAKWGWGKKLEGLPYFEDATMRQAKRIFNYINFVDVYDPGFPAAAEAEVKKVTARRKGDPDLIAYAMENENGWSDRTLTTILQQDHKSYSKRAFFAFLAKRHGGEAKAAALAGQPGLKGDALLDKKYELKQFNRKDLDDFITETSRIYHKLLYALYKKYDPDHLFMGGSHCSHQSLAWIYGQVEYVDFVGLHVYSYQPGWIKPVIPFLEKSNKAFALLEFSFVRDVAGFRFYGADTTCGTVRDRGILYRHFTEYLATVPNCLGFGYFIYYDQPINGRGIGGEAHNFGLVSQQDRPYFEMVEEVKKSNLRLFDIHAGMRPIFQDPLPQSHLGSSMMSDYVRRCLPGTVGSHLSIDFGHANRYHGTNLHFKVSEIFVTVKKPYSFGAMPLTGKKNAVARFRFYCWDKNDAHTRLTLEATRDGKTFVKIPSQTVRARQGIDFTEYMLESTAPLTGFKGVRPVFDIPSVNHAWSALLCEQDEISPDDGQIDFKGSTAAFLPGSSDRALVVDRGGQPAWFDGSAARLKIAENRIPKAGKYAFGTVSIEGKQTILIRAYCWTRMLKDAKTILLADVSRDGVRYSVCPLRVREGRRNKDYTECFFTPEACFPAGTKYLRLSLNVNDRAKSWIVQLCGFQLQ